MTISPEGSGAAASATAYASRRGVISWFFFDWAAQPYYTLITTFIFAPYFASHVAADEVSGQAIWGFAAGAAGIVIALFSPMLGAIADATGNRKPWIAAFSLPLIVGCALLWFAEPGSVAIAIIGFVVATIGAEFATTFNNAMMPSLVPPNRLGRLSGTGWAIGYLGGLVSLVIMLGLLVGDIDDGKTFFGLTPLLGLDPADYGGDRASGPFSAIWYVVFVLPLFLFTPDAPRRMAVRTAVRKGLAELAATLRSVRHYGNVFRFLIARMIYNDGLLGLFAFGGIYAVSIFDWTTTEVGMFGILLTITGTLGAFVGGRLDDRLGSKAVILGSLTVLVVASLLAVSIDADSILFGIASAPPLADDGLFASTGEQLYLILGAAIGAVAGPLQAASRALLVRLAPRPRITQFFGLYALTGKLTTFVAALAVALLTTLSGSQRIGISVLVVFFVAGGVLMLGVRERQTGRA